MSAPGGPGQCWQWSPVSRLTGHQWNQLGLNWLLETLRAFLVSEARRGVHSTQLRLSGPIVRHLMLSHNTIIDPSSPLSSVSVSVQSAHNHYQRSAISLITWVWDLGSNVISIWAWPGNILMGQSGLGCTWDIGLCGKMHSTIQGRNVSTALNIQTGTSQKCNRGKGLLNKSRSISPFDYSP